MRHKIYDEARKTARCGTSTGAKRNTITLPHTEAPRRGGETSERGIWSGTLIYAELLTTRL